MIEVLESLNYKTNKDLTSIGVSANNVTLPVYSQNLVDGRYVYSKTYIPEYIEGAVNYSVSGQSVTQKLIRDFIDLKSSYDPIDYQSDYLSNTVYNQLSSLDIANFLFWYDVVNVYSVPTVKTEINKPLYNEFSNSVGELMLYTPSMETTPPGNISTGNIKPYNRLIESNIIDDIRTSIDQGYNDASSSYTDNTINVAGTALPTTSHGSRLIVDANNDTRYTGASAQVLNSLNSLYNQLMYISPLYATMQQTASFINAPFFNATINNQSVVVDKLGNKVNINQGWTEQVMFSAYEQE